VVPSSQTSFFLQHQALTGMLFKIEQPNEICGFKNSGTIRKTLYFLRKLQKDPISQTFFVTCVENMIYDQEGIVPYYKGPFSIKKTVVNAAFLSFETSKLWALICIICR
jgi:hypothetical protein